MPAELSIPKLSGSYERAWLRNSSDPLKDHEGVISGQLGWHRARERPEGLQHPLAVPMQSPVDSAPTGRVPSEHKLRRSAPRTIGRFGTQGLEPDPVPCCRWLRSTPTVISLKSYVPSKKLHFSLYFNPFTPAK